MDEANSVRRIRQPFVVRLVVIIVYITGVISVVTGTLVLLSRYQAEGDAAVVTVSLVGAAIILLGLLTIAGGSAIARGSRLARLLITIYVSVLLVLNLITIIITEAWDLPSAIVMGLEAFIVVAMWVPPGRGYFRIRRVDEGAATPVV